MKTVYVLNTLKSEVGQVIPNTYLGSLKLFTKVPSPPFALIVPDTISSNSVGTQHSEVRERHLVVVAVSTNGSNPYMDLVQLTLRVVERLQGFVPPDPPDATFRAVDVVDIRFDTIPEALDLSLITATVTVEVSYYEV